MVGHHLLVHVVSVLLSYVIFPNILPTLQENHMNSVMMSVLEGPGAAQGDVEEQVLERSAEKAKLGVNLLLFAGSRYPDTDKFYLLDT